MLPRVVVILMMVAILASLGSAAVFLLRDQRRGSRRMVKALTWRIGLSLTLFILLMAGFYFGLISPHGLSPR